MLPQKSKKNMNLKLPLKSVCSSVLQIFVLDTRVSISWNTLPTSKNAISLRNSIGHGNERTWFTNEREIGFDRSYANEVKRKTTVEWRLIKIILAAYEIVYKVGKIAFDFIHSAQWPSRNVTMLRLLVAASLAYQISMEIHRKLHQTASNGLHPYSP